MKRYSINSAIISAIIYFLPALSEAKEVTSASNKDPTASSWVVPEGGKFLVLNQQPGYSLSFERKGKNVHTHAWAREIPDKREGIKETIRITVMEDLGDLMEQSIDISSANFIENLAKDCKTDFRNTRHQNPKSRFSMLKMSCGSNKDGVGYSAVEVMFNDGDNLIMLGWIFHDSPGKFLEMNDPKWDEVMNVLFPVYSCERSSEANNGKHHCKPYNVIKNSTPK